MKLVLAFVLLSFLYLSSIAQDTINVMTYNILNYGNFTSYGTMVNNDPFVKEDYLRTVFEYASPDVVGINEIGGASQAYANRLLDTVLNNVFPGRYAKSNFFNTTASSLVNMLYYDVTKFGMKQQWSIDDGIRDICFFKLYYKSPDTEQGDTVFITFVSMHLKAGTTPADETDRATETQALMDHIYNNNLTGNIMVMGDFNVYSSNDDCFQNLVNYSVSSVRFYDPINKLGNWNNSSSFADYHTQSTSAPGTDCAASGGMDDRFDFILINESIKYNTAKASYVTGSYKAIGQDGNHFNLSVSDNTNTSAPSDVIDALQAASDHLPVIMKLKINQSPASVPANTSENWKKPVYIGDNSWLLPTGNSIQNFNVYVWDITGRMASVLTPEGVNPVISLSRLNPGLYIIQYYSGGKNQSFKIIKE